MATRRTIPPTKRALSTSSLSRPWPAEGRDRPGRGGKHMRAAGLIRVVVIGSTVMLWVSLQVAIVQTQQRGGTPETDKVPPINTGANPYRVIRDWAQLSTEG